MTKRFINVSLLLSIMTVTSKEPKDQAESPLIIQSHGLEVQITEQGQVSISKGIGGQRVDFMNSDKVMFPVVGEVPGYTATIPGEIVSAILTMDEDGIAGLIPFHVNKEGMSFAEMWQAYEGPHTSNPLHLQDASRPVDLQWPFPYTIDKTVSLDGGSQVKLNLKLTHAPKFQTGKIKPPVIPYVIGYSMEFNVHGDPGKSLFFAEDKDGCISLENVVARHEGVLLLRDTNSVTYVSRDTQLGVVVETNNFGNMVVRVPSIDSGTFRIEPVTNLPGRYVPFQEKEEGEFHSLEAKKSRTYSVEITPLHQVNR